MNSSILQKPKVNTYTNRKTKISGTAEPLSDIYFETTKKTYKAKVSVDGTFSYALPAQLGNTKLYVYVKDELGRESEKTLVKVKTTGPNAPTVNTFTNKVTKITGDTRDDTVSVYAIIDNTVYVSNDGGDTVYEESEKYDTTYNIEVTTITIAKDGTYSIKVPLQLPDTEITIYTVDHLHRVSRVAKTTTKDVAPNAPTIYDVTNIERTIYGSVYNTSNEDRIYDIEVTIGEDLYNGTTDENGNFAIPVSKLSAGDLVKVKAIDYVGGTTRTSYQRSKTVEDINKYIDKEENFVLDTINNKKYSIDGYYVEGEDTIFISINKKVYEVATDEDGNFNLEFDNTLNPGTPIYIYSRYVDGGIIDVNKYVVALAKPDKPELSKSRITNASKVLDIITDKDSTVTVKVGDKKYTTSKYYYDSTLDAYVYSVTITKVNSGTDIKIYASNKAGTSSVYQTSVVKTAPNTPKVNPVIEGDKDITGTVDIVPITDSDEEQVTKVYAQIGKKIYVGKVGKTGKIKINIPAQKKGTKIYIWGENNSGRGPTKVITVKGK
jgi:hypothetical protein